MTAGHINEAPDRQNGWLGASLCLVSNFSILVPPAGFEPAHPAPEAGALSPELRGLSDQRRVAGSPSPG